MVRLKGSSSGEQCERLYNKQRRVGCGLGEPAQRSRRLSAELAGLGVSPQLSSSHPSPTSPHPHSAEGRHSLHTQSSPSPSLMYFSGQLSVIQLTFYRLCIFQAPKLQSFTTDYNSSLDLCLLYPLVRPSQSTIGKAWVGTEVEPLKRFPEHRFFIVMQLMVSYVLARLTQFTGSHSPKACLRLCVDEGLGVGLMDCWSFPASMPWSSAGLPGPGLCSISVLPQRSQERHFPLREVALDFLP